MEPRTTGRVVLSRAKRRWVGSVFGTVPQAAIRRRPTDVVRVVVAGAVVALLAWSAQRLTGLEQWLIEAVEKSPGDLHGLWHGLYLVGGLVATVPLVVTAVVGRRWRLALTMLGAALVAGAMSVLLHDFVHTVSPSTVSSADPDWTGTIPAFPTIGLALAAAVVIGAAPLLTRPTRRLLVAVLAVSTLGALLALESLPTSVIGAVVIAWGAAALVHLAVGSPAGVPNPSDVVASLRAIGVEVHDVELVDDHGGGETRFSAPSADGSRLSVTVLGRDAAGHRLVTEGLRRLWMKDADHLVALTRLGVVEHRAFLLLLAERGGAAVPELLAAGTGGELDDALLVTREPAGTPLDALDADDLTDEVLDSAWRNVARLHDAMVVHGDLRAANVRRLGDGSVALVGVDRLAPLAELRAEVDDATLLVTTAAIVGPERAFDAMERTVGSAASEAVLPLLQRAALPGAERHGIPHLKELLSSLREQAATRLGTDPPELAQLHRVAPANIVMAAGAALGVYLLLGELANVQGLGAMIRSAAWGWVLVAFVLSQTPQLMQAIGMLGSVAQRIPLGPATVVQFANQFMGLVGGTVASTATTIRFFQKLGMSGAVAISSGVLNTLATMATQAVLLILGLVASRGDWQVPTSRSASGSGSSTGGLVAIGILLAAVVGAVVLTLPRFRRRIVAKLRPQMAAARDNLRDVRSQPRKALELFGGNAASQLLFALTLYAALRAYGVSLPILQLVVINTLASLLGGIAPVPGGMGVIEAGLIAGMMAAGVPQTEATAATFTARTFTAYLPPIWGWFSLRWLQQRDYV